MKDKFIDFSSLKFVTEAPVNPIEVEQGSAAKAAAGGEKQVSNTARRREKQGVQMAAKTGSPTQASQIDKNVVEHLHSVREDTELFKRTAENLYDWREALREEAGEEEPDLHPYVKVMPPMNYKETEAKKELEAAAKSQRTMARMEGMSSPGFRKFFAEGQKEFPMKKVERKLKKTEDAPAMNRKEQDTLARREKGMKTAMAVHGDPGMRAVAKDATKSVENTNRVEGGRKRAERAYARSSTKNKAYELEGQRRRDLNARAKRTSKDHPKTED